MEHQEPSAKRQRLAESDPGDPDSDVQAIPPLPGSDEQPPPGSDEQTEQQLEQSISGTHTGAGPKGAVLKLNASQP